jgi:hypothetical protein
MRLIDADQFDELVEIVDALASVVKRIINEAVYDKAAADSVAERARRLYQRRVE